MKMLEPTRSTLPNTDQPRIPHSEYHYTWLSLLLLLIASQRGALLAPLASSVYQPVAPVAD